MQRRLTRLGFDVHVNGKFDDETRNVIKRWQAVRSFPTTGYLTREQHAALISENLAARAPSEDDNSASSSSDDEGSHSRRVHHSSGGGGGRHYYRGGGPPNIFGGLMRPLFGR